MNVHQSGTPVTTKFAQIHASSFACSAHLPLDMKSNRKDFALFALLRVCFLLSMYHCTAGEQLVLPEGVEHSILCTAPDDDRYLITWVDDDGAVANGFVVGEEETAGDGMKGKRITFTATTDISNISLICNIIDLLQVSNSYKPIELTIIIQGGGYTVFVD